MKSIAVTTKRSINIEGRSGKGVTYKARLSPENSSGFDDGRNSSSLENESHVLKEAIEVPMLVRVAIERFITDYIENNNINIDTYNKAVSFYKVTMIPPTVINELIVALFISETIGSAYCVRYINMDMMVRILVLIQMYAAHSGFGSIVPILTIINTGVFKSEIDEVDNTIILSEGRGEPGKVNYYVSIRESLIHLDGFQVFNLDELMKNIMLFIVSSYHQYNLAPTIAESCKCGNTVQRDGVLKYDTSVINDLYHFIYHLMISDNKSRRLE
jgi:hypothetical protein